jgi:AraC-like DNA-binding protein
MHFGFYTIFLKDVKCGDMVYGRNTYDYQEGTLVFMAPGQVAGVNSNGEIYQPKGHGLVFHADLIHGTTLGRHIGDYSFFGYQSNEALHLSERERNIVLDCFSKIDYELEQSIDKHSKRLIVANIQLLLDYCVRFYDRQFITRDHVHHGILEKFEEILNSYFESDKPQTVGLPSVAHCADQLHLSPNYFGDLVKKETGKTASEYIQTKLIDIAKERIFDQNKTVSQIAYELGFKYPQHFARLFKQKVGHSPLEYRSMN